MAQGATGRDTHGRVPGSTGNLPYFSLVDRLGILVAIVGTVVLVVIAASSGGGLSAQHDLGSLNLSSQVIRIAIAGAMGLVNIANIVGLVLFSSVDYRGPWHRFFAYVSLYGTLIAIPVALLV